MGKRKKICLLLTAVLLLTGCGEEAVHTGAQPAETAAEAADTDSEVADTEESTMAEPADGENAWVALEDQTADAADGENVRAAREDQIADAVEMDETLRTELTEELLAENGMDTSVVEGTLVTKGCSFTPPEAFAESEDIEGMYVTKRYPIDASAIHYTTLEKDEAMQLMTEETFKAQTEEQFEGVYGEEIEVTVDSFERMKIDGCPAFRILCHYRVGDTEMTQLEYAINADKSYVITYSQTDEYDYMEEYEASAETIHLKF